MFRFQVDAVAVALRLRAFRSIWLVLIHVVVDVARCLDAQVHRYLLVGMH
jgi:hypothetical protein